MRVFGCEHLPSHVHQLRVTNNNFHQPFRQSHSSMAFDDEDVSQPGERAVVGDNSSKPDLFVIFMNSKFNEWLRER